MTRRRVATSLCDPRVWALTAAVLATVANTNEPFAASPTMTPTPPSVLPQPERLVAIGDLHGDLSQARRALRLAGVLHASNDEWVGGESVVVQVGDQVDRGDDELGVLALLQELKGQAEEAGGGLHVLVGNHEIMSAQGNARYATEGAMRKFAQWAKVCQHKGLLPPGVAKQNHCQLYTQPGPLSCPEGDTQCFQQVERMAPYVRARFLALRAGGPIAKDLLAPHRSAALVVGSTAFVHGGMLKAEHLDGYGKADATPAEALTAMNLDMSDFLAGKKGQRLPEVAGYRGILWNRALSGAADVDKQTCAMLRETLQALPGKPARMVVGHTVQPGGKVSSSCDGAIWRIDIGLSSGVLGSAPQVLEVKADGTVRVLSETPDACSADAEQCAGQAAGGSDWLAGPSVVQRW